MTASKRKFSNIKLTQQFHYRHMGLWVIISISLIVLLNISVYLLLTQQWLYLGGMATDEPDAARMLTRFLGGFLLVETLLFCIAIVYMARATSHRIAGAFIALKKTCDRVSAGERSVRQKFRSYDHLDDLERSFNRMLDSLTPPDKR
jgi:methyl-accepting chemotaxis protein